MYQTIITSIMASLKQIKIRSPTPYMGTVVLAIIAAFPFFLLGYDVAITRASDMIAEDLRLSADQSDHFLMSMSRGPLGAGALAAGVAANFFGRKYTAAFGGSVYIVGTLILAFAHSYAVASCGRVLAGFGTGMGLLVGPIYIAEIAPASVRSFLGHFPQVMIAMGMMAAYTMEAALIRVQPHIGWRLIIGVSALPTLAFTVLACCIPDSPCWLVMLGKVDSARQLLENCRGPKKDDDDDSDEEEDDEVDVRMKQLNRVAGFELYCTGNNVAGAPRRIIGFIEVLQDTFDENHVFQSLFKTTLLLVAQEAIFEDRVFQSLVAALGRNGLGCCLSSAIAGVMLAAVLLLSTLLSASCANGLGGRRALLLLSILVAACSLGALGATFFADAHDLVGHGTAFAFYSVEIVVLLAAVGVGVGPYPWMYGPEAFPLPARAPCVAVCIVVKYAFRFVFCTSVPMFYAPSYGIWEGFLLASGVQVVSFVLCCIFVRDMTGEVLVDRM